MPAKVHALHAQTPHRPADPLPPRRRTVTRPRLRAALKTSTVHSGGPCTTPPVEKDRRESRPRPRARSSRGQRAPASPLGIECHASIISLPPPRFSLARHSQSPSALQARRPPLSAPQRIVAMTPAIATSYCGDGPEGSSRLGLHQANDELKSGRWSLTKP